MTVWREARLVRHEARLVTREASVLLPAIGGFRFTRRRRVFIRPKGERFARTPLVRREAPLSLLLVGPSTPMAKSLWGATKRKVRARR